jgi:hypothetical protein
MKNHLFLILATAMLFHSPAFARGGGSHGSHHSRGRSHRSASHQSSGLESHSYVHVRDYEKRNGHHVDAHERTTPDHTKINNWSTKGNVNPTTGQPGTKNP